MLRIAPVLLLVAVAITGNGPATADERQKKQAELDAACEAARQTALAPKRAEIYQECVGMLEKSAGVCEQEAAGYNGNRVGAAPLFYDLPACEAAFEYQNSE